MANEARVDLMAVTEQLAHAWMTEHGALLCDPCEARNRGQFQRAGLSVERVPCDGALLCDLCNRAIAEGL